MWFSAAWPNGRAFSPLQLLALGNLAINHNEDVSQAEQGCLHTITRIPVNEVMDRLSFRNDRFVNLIYVGTKMLLLGPDRTIVGPEIGFLNLHKSIESFIAGMIL